jgi:spore germination protein KB
MQEHAWSARQGFAVLILFLIGSAAVLSPGKEASRDIWLAGLLAFAMAVPLAFLYGRLIHIYPEKNLHDMQLEFFGPFFGRATCAIFVWYCLHIGAMILREFSEFIQIETFSYVQQYVFAVPLGVLCIWCIRSGVNTLGRWALIVVPFYLAMLLLNSFLSLGKWQINHLEPFLYDGFKPVIAGAIKIWTLPFLEVPLVVILCQPFKRGYKASRMFLGSFAAGAVMLIFLFTRNVMVLGPHLVQKYLFPSYEVVGLANVGGFIQGLEVLGAIVFMVGYFTKLTVFLYGATSGVSKILKIDDYRSMAAPMGLLFITFSLFVAKNLNELLDWVDKMFTVYTLPIGLLIPLALWIIGEWKYQKKKKRDSQAQKPEPDSLADAAAAPTHPG